MPLMKFHMPSLTRRSRTASAPDPTAGSSSTPPQPTVPPPTALPRNVGTKPAGNFNTSGQITLFDVELIKSGAEGSAFLPIFLEVGSDGIALKRKVGLPAALG